MSRIDIDDVNERVKASIQLVHQFNYDLAQSLLLRLLQELKGVKDKRLRLLQAQSAEALAMILRDKEIIFGKDGAIRHFSFAESIFRDLNDYNGLTRCINQAGVAYRMIGEYPKAFGRFQEALSLSSYVPQPDDLKGSLRRNIATTLIMTGVVTDAESELRASFSLLEGGSDLTAFSITAQKLAALRACRGDFKEALQLFKVAEEHISERKNVLYAFTNQLVLAAISLDMANLPQAQESVRRASSIMADLPLLPLQSKRFSVLQGEIDHSLRQSVPNMEPSVLILGPDGTTEALERLHAIRDAVPSGINTIIVKEEPDRGVEPVINKVRWLASRSINTFVLMECSEASGHLNEFEALKGDYPMALFRQRGRRDTYMTAHEPLYHSMMNEYEYTDLLELRKTVVQATDWGVACLLRSQAAIRMKQPWTPSPTARVTKHYLSQ